MKTMLKNGAYSLVALASVAQTHAAINGGTDRVTGNLKGNGDTNISDAIQNFLQFLLLFLGLIAIVIFLWAGFNIMTAAGDEEKVKKGKTMMIQAGIGVIVIFFAWQIVSWIFSAATSGAGA